MDIIGDEIIGEQHNVYEAGQSAMSECAEDVRSIFLFLIYVFISI